MAYLIDEHPESDDTPPVRRRPPRKVRKVAKMAQPDLPLAKKAEAPDLPKAMLLDQLDDGAPLALMIKSVAADPLFAADLRRRILAPNALEKTVSAMESDIQKVLAFVEPQSKYRHRNGNGIHAAPSQPRPASTVTARHYDYDEPESPQARLLTKAIESDSHRDTRVATIRRLLGITEAQERARTETLQARIANLRSGINKALAIGSTLPEPNATHQHKN